MAVRTTTTQVVQLGVEVTPGTPVPANKRLASLMFDIGPDVTQQVFGPSGYKFDTVQAMGREFVSGSYSGKLTYSELPYVLSSVLKKVTATQIMDDVTPTGAYRWLYDLSSTVVETPQTYSIEKGSNLIAEKSDYLFMTSFGLDFSRDDVEVDGELMARLLTAGAVLTGSPTALALKPVLGKTVDVYLDTTSAGLGTTKLTRVLKGSLKLEGRYGLAWYLNSANQSFTEHMELKTGGSITLTMEADAAAMALLAQMRSGESRFMRIEATGESIYVGALPQSYRVRLDQHVRVGKPSPMRDEDGIYAIEWEFPIQHDETWGKALTWEVINTSPAL